MASRTQWYFALVAQPGPQQKSITVNLREESGRDLVRQLAAQCDVLVENFRPGTLEKWGLAPATLKTDNEQLIIARISGYGQTVLTLHVRVSPPFVKVLVGFVT